MPNRLHRYCGAGYRTFITTRCYRREPLLDNPTDRDLFLRVLEQVRRRCRFVVVGYVVMPEHVHLLIGRFHDVGNRNSHASNIAKRGAAGFVVREFFAV